MPRKKKNQLPSGNIRIQVYDYTDENGKKHYQSFTAPTATEAKAKAAEWKEQRRQIKSRLLVCDAVDQYITMKTPVLSPSTIRGYRSLQDTYFKKGQSFAEQDLRTIDNTAIQFWVSSLAVCHSPKTVRNIFGLFSSVVSFYLPDFRLRVTLPSKVKPDLYTPSDDDIKALLSLCSGTEMEIAILLAAFGPMRRSEICALEDKDIKGNVVTINKSRVKDEWHLWVTKPSPKTYSSNRSIEMPSFVIDKMNGIKGRIVTLEPDSITRKFQHLEKKAKLPGHVRFHDLRHYAASIMHAEGIPDQYIMKRGGWSSTSIMKTVYQNVIDIEDARQTRKIVSEIERKFV